MEQPSNTVALASGGLAGLAVDISLFPLDTLKTRLQSEAGFIKSGGFRGIYAGLGAAAANSVPSAALFFLTYEKVKSLLLPKVGDSQQYTSIVHMTAACSGEVAACLFRVPSEVVKQRAQTAAHIKTFKIFTTTLQSEGIFGFYRGYWSTIVREVPFSLIQFPLWEYLKKEWATYQNDSIKPWQSALCGSLSGGVAAGLTTPLDVAKTRIMLAQRDNMLAKGHIFSTLRHVYQQNGVKGLYAGIGPRVMWISIGGALFLGVYDASKNFLTHLRGSS